MKDDPAGVAANAPANDEKNSPDTKELMVTYDGLAPESRQHFLQTARQ